MNTLLNHQIVRERARDAQQAADLRGARIAAATQKRDEAVGTVIALRYAHADEGDLVHHLAQLDEAPEPRGEVLLALVDGEPVAALGLDDGRVVATPFRSTGDAVAHLRLSADRIARAQHVAPRRRFRRTARARLAA